MRIKGKQISLTDDKAYIKLTIDNAYAEIELSPSELAEQIKNNGYILCKLDKDGWATMEPDTCTCDKPKEQYYSPNVPNWCMNCGKPLPKKEECICDKCIEVCKATHIRESCPLFKLSYTTTSPKEENVVQVQFCYCSGGDFCPDHNHIKCLTCGRYIWKQREKK